MSTSDPLSPTPFEAAAALGPYGSMGREGRGAVTRGTCVVCLEYAADTVFVHAGAGHQAGCYDCAVRILGDRLPCPVCRRPVDMVIRNFL